MQDWESRESEFPPTEPPQSPLSGGRDFRIFGSGERAMNRTTTNRRARDCMLLSEAGFMGFMGFSGLGESVGNRGVFAWAFPPAYSV